MTDKHQSFNRNLIRGGQVLIHNFRMLRQVSIRAVIAATIVFVLVTVGLTYLRLNKQQAYAVQCWAVAQAWNFFDEKTKIVVTDQRTKITHKVSKLLNSPWLKIPLKQANNIFVSSIFYGQCSGILSLFLLFIILAKRGKKHSETKKLRGYEIATAKQAKKLLPQKARSNIQIAGLSMPKDFETGHILIHGTTGMGKSVCIKELLDQIRKRGDRAIICDQGCDYVGSFYTEEDIILNPLDERTASWNLWQECRYSADYDSLAAALIPSTTHSAEQFWSNGARIIFAAMAKKLKSISEMSIDLLLEAILKTKISEIEALLSDTEAASLVSSSIEKTALSFRSMLATYLKCLKYVKDEEKPFSIRQWVQDDNKINWLFISSLADSHETLKPLISMWLDLAANSLMSLAPSYTRRIWLIFDELASLHKLPYLPNAFAQSRKFGGCIVAGIQSISQLRKVYGQHAADEISNMCNTRIFFRAPSNEAAVWTSKELGQHEIEEMKEGISYSESAMRSGISINKQTVYKDLITPAEIMNLRPLDAYIRLPGKFPITKITLQYKDRKSATKSFIPRKIIENLDEASRAETTNDNEGSQSTNCNELSKNTPNDNNIEHQEKTSDIMSVFDIEKERDLT
jgi:type IV conjugative transfer system coupling protein TraD